ncbi:MAG: hypothetical protein JKX91_08155 [Rhizobiaceae bacterium]|nr:hypothetical protein [Rhizobiaceae bacterium]
MLAALIFSAHAWAANITSAYSNLNIDTDCKFYGENIDGGTARCTGYENYPVHFAEGDLRQMVQFGFVEKPFEQWQSFGEFNRINNVIEWRLNSRTPYATILRWFIENVDPDTGSPNKAYLGQILVVSTVGSDDYPESCVVGYVDTRANNNANELAREVADNLASTFRCGIDKPEYHGKKSKYAGSIN